MKELHYKTAVSELSQSPYYQCVVNAIAKVAPLVPEFDYKGQTNIEEIKAKLAHRTMHDLVMKILRGE